MTEAQTIVLNWKANLKSMGWPEEAIRKIVSELCEAGYRQCIDDIKRHDHNNEVVLHAATGGQIN